MDYGTGAIMGVPAHDTRDWDFAKANDLSIFEVISGGSIKKQAYIGEGKIVNSEDWNGLSMPKQITKIIIDVEKKGWGEASTTYHLRDWLISRQRYWGPPIPMIFCQSCADNNKSFFSIKKGKLLRKDQSDWESKGWYPEENLPVELPYLADYKPKGTGRGPLADHSQFVKTKCPECGESAVRETDVSDTFVDSSWYFLRYPSVGSKTSKLHAFDPKITKKWLPVSLYFGGAEHSVLHLMYARFVTQVLSDLKLLDFDEPFPWFFAHGLMIKDGAKMSKSKGNVVNPDEYIEKFGADTLRLYLMFMGPMDGYPDFRDTGIEGMRRFIERVWDIYANYPKVVIQDKKDSKDLLTKIHQTIKKVTEDIEKFRYNTSISSIMELVNEMRDMAIKLGSGKHKSNLKCAEWDEALQTLALIIAPFAPHLAEEVWVEVLGKKFSIHTTKWPNYKNELVQQKTVEVVVQVNGKLRCRLTLPTSIAEEKSEVLSLVKKDKKIIKWIKGKKIINIIFVPGKLVNLVI